MISVVSPVPVPAGASAGQPVYSNMESEDNIHTVDESSSAACSKTISPHTHGNPEVQNFCEETSTTEMQRGSQNEDEEQVRVHHTTCLWVLSKAEEELPLKLDSIDLIHCLMDLNRDSNHDNNSHANIK